MSEVGSDTYFFFFYVEKVYPSFPQELGGAKPFSATLDLRRDIISEEFYMELNSSESLDNDSEVITRSFYVEETGWEQRQQILFSFKSAIAKEKLST